MAAAKSKTSGSRKAPAKAIRPIAPAVPVQSVAEPPEELKKALAQGKCALFVGAGLSRAAGYPAWAGLLEQLISKCDVPTPRPTTQMAELRGLAKEPSKYLLVAQEVSDILGDEIFRAELSSIFKVAHAPTKVHETLVGLPFSLALTTNYDNLLELAYVNLHKRLPPSFVHNQAADFADALWRNEFFVLKAHGDANNRNSMVITERDYRSIIHRAAGYRSAMAAIFTTKTVLFLGVSLSDPELSLMLSHLHDSFYGSAPTHYALVPNTEFNSTVVNRWHKDYSIRCLTYAPDASHSQVGAFVEKLRPDVNLTS